MMIPPVPTDAEIERIAMTVATMKAGEPQWPAHLSEAQRDIYRVKVMELIALVRLTFAEGEKR